MNRVLIITSIVTAIAVLIYTVFAGLQWWAIRKQGAYASQQVGKMQGQLDAMRDQARIMDDSLIETRKSMRYSQSAYVTVKAIDITKFVVGQPIEVTIIFTNSGITPAYNTNFYSRGGPRSEPFTFSAAEIVNDDFQHGVFSQGILGPHGDDAAQVFESRFPLNEQGIEFMRTKPYHAWGVVFYQDIFKRDRWTQFCYVWRPEVRVFEICKDCNKTDDQE